MERKDLEIKCDYKTVIFSLHSNEQGYFMKVFERKTDDRRTTPRVIIDEDSFEILLEIIMEYNSDYKDILAYRERNFLVRTESFNRGFRLYYVDVFQTRSSKHFRLTMVANGRRKYVTFPFSQLPTYYKRLCGFLGKEAAEKTVVPEASMAESLGNTVLFADGYNQSLKKFKQKRRKFWRIRKGLFPPQNNIIDWNVYLMYRSWTSHFGLAFEPAISQREGEENKYEYLFRVDLALDFDNVKVHRVWLYLESFKFNENSKKGKYLSTINKSGNEILNVAYKRLVKMGNYNYFTNNCQDYTKLLAIDLGLTGVDTFNDKLKKMCGFSKESAMRITQIRVL